MGIVDRFDHILTKFLMVTSSSLLLIITLVMFIEVVGRYVFLHSLPWAGELMRYSAVWLVFLAGGLGVKRGAHISVKVITKRFPRDLQRSLALFEYSMIGLFSAIMLWQGIKLVGLTAHQLSPSMHISMAIPYAAVPVGGLIMLIYGIILSSQTMIKSR